MSRGNASKQANDINFRFNVLSRKLSTREIMAAAAQLVRDNIFVRTNSGKDKDNRSFKKYSPKYSAKEGKTLVNMTQTGQMMNSMSFKALSKNRGLVFFSNSRAINLAKKHNEEGIGREKIKREFFGANDMDQKDVISQYQKAIDEEIRRSKL